MEIVLCACCSMELIRLIGYLACWVLKLYVDNTLLLVQTKTVQLCCTTEVQCGLFLIFVCSDFVKKLIVLSYNLQFTSPIRSMWIFILIQAL